MILLLLLLLISERRWKENSVLPRMSICGMYMCVLCVFVSIYVPYFHNPAVHGRFYGLDFKKREMVVLENKPWRSLD